MKKKIIKGLIKVLILIMLFSGISFFLKADIESKYKRNYLISNSTIINIKKRTSGCIYFKLAKVQYRIKIRTLRYSNLMLNDSIEESNLKEIYYPDMSAGQYIYDLQIKRSGLYEQCFLTTTMSAKLRVEITTKK